MKQSYEARGLSLASELHEAASRSTGNVRDWHRPSNDGCAHNHNIAENCTCALVINGSGKKKHKARVVFRCTDHEGVNLHNVKHDFVVELHDDGKLIVRESKRRVSYETSVGAVYCRLVRNHALAAAAERARARAASRKTIKAAKKLAMRVARKRR